MGLLENISGWRTNGLRIVLLSLFIGCIILEHRATVASEAADNVWKKRYETQQKVNDSTVALLASSQKKSSDLAALDSAARAMGGRVVAGVKIVYVPVTVEAHDTLQTTRDNDVAHAAVHDTTSFATLDGTITAPRTGAIIFNYDLKEIESDPVVGFVQDSAGQSVAAVVSWRNKRMTVKAPYFNVAPPIKRLHETVGVYLNEKLQYGMTASVGYELWGGIAARASVDQNLVLGAGPTMKVGLVKVF